MALDKICQTKHTRMNNNEELLEELGGSCTSLYPSIVQHQETKELIGTLELWLH